MRPAADLLSRIPEGWGALIGQVSATACSRQLSGCGWSGLVILNLSGLWEGDLDFHQGFYGRRGRRRLRGGGGPAGATFDLASRRSAISLSLAKAWLICRAATCLVIPSTS